VAELVSVADGLYAQDDYSFLPPTVKAWGGYVGKPEVNAWTVQQVAHLEATGRLWIPIWTPGDGTTYTRAEATADAAAMLAGLSRLGLHDQRWVFLDIERSRWINTPAQTEDAAAYWCSIMRASGWPRAGWYGPLNSGAPWQAHWTGVPPVTLPPGVIGLQYDHALANDRYDISRFDPTILEVGAMSVNGPEHWDPADWNAMRANLPALAPYDPTHPGAPSVATVLHVLLGVRDGTGAPLPNTNNIPEILAAVEAIPAAGGPASYHGTVELTAGP
jgi:hypothetical protein